MQGPTSHWPPIQKFSRNIPCVYRLWRRRKPKFYSHHVRVLVSFFSWAWRKQAHELSTRIHIFISIQTIENEQLLQSFSFSCDLCDMDKPASCHHIGMETNSLFVDLIFISTRSIDFMTYDYLTIYDYLTYAHLCIHASTLYCLLVIVSAYKR